MHQKDTFLEGLPSTSLATTIQETYSENYNGNTVVASGESMWTVPTGRPSLWDGRSSRGCATRIVHRPISEKCGSFSTRNRRRWSGPITTIALTMIKESDLV